MIVVVPFNGSTVPSVASQPRQSTHTVVQMPSVQEMLAKQNAEQGRKAWDYIHTSNESPEIVLQKFEAMIPSYGCGCQNKYLRIKKDFPPDMTDSDSLWRWGWFVHNLVNEKLGKPLIDLEEARRIWNRPQPTE